MGRGPFSLFHCGVNLIRMFLFNATESSICKCCAIDSEEIVHMLAGCLALFAQRKQYVCDLRSLIVNCVGIKQLESAFNTKANIVRQFLVCSSFACLDGKRSS